MPREEIVRWLRTKHDDLHKCTDVLRERAAKSPPGTRDRWIAELGERFDQFADCLHRHMAEEEQDGYLKPVLDTRPSLVESVELLRCEHAELARIVDSVQSAVRRLSPTDNLLLRDCCKRIETLLTWVERHQEHENHIVLYVLAGETND